MTLWATGRPFQGRVGEMSLSGSTGRNRPWFECVRLGENREILPTMPSKFARCILCSTVGQSISTDPDFQMPLQLLTRSTFARRLAPLLVIYCDETSPQFRAVPRAPVGGLVGSCSHLNSSLQPEGYLDGTKQMPGNDTLSQAEELLR